MLGTLMVDRLRVGVGGSFVSVGKVLSEGSPRGTCRIQPGLHNVVMFCSV